VTDAVPTQKVSVTGGEVLYRSEASPLLLASLPSAELRGGLNELTLL
jgi:hypothetical protein